MSEYLKCTEHKDCLRGIGFFNGQTWLFVPSMEATQRLHYQQKNFNFRLTTHHKVWKVRVQFGHLKTKNAPLHVSCYIFIKQKFHRSILIYIVNKFQQNILIHERFFSFQQDCKHSMWHIYWNTPIFQYSQVYFQHTGSKRKLNTTVNMARM